MKRKIKRQRGKKKNLGRIPIASAEQEFKDKKKYTRKKKHTKEDEY